MNSPFYDEIVAAGHVLKLDGDGDIDSFALSYDFHNGPGCSVCGASWCEHCGDPIRPCIGVEGVAAREAEALRKRIQDAATLLRSNGYVVTDEAKP